MGLRSTQTSHPSTGGKKTNCPIFLFTAPCFVSKKVNFSKRDLLLKGRDEKEGDRLPELLLGQSQGKRSGHQPQLFQVRIYEQKENPCYYTWNKFATVAQEPRMGSVALCNVCLGDTGIKSFFCKKVFKTYHLHCIQFLFYSTSTFTINPIIV